MSVGRGRITSVLVAVVADERGGGVLQPLDASGRPAGPAEDVVDLAGAVAAREAADRPRWVWATGGGVYPGLLRAGVRLDRCHDVELTEALLLGHAGRWGEPRALPAAWARLTGAPVPPDPAPRPPEPPGHGQAALFEPPSGPAGPGVPALTRVYADQLARIAATAHPGRFRLLVAAESAGALVAAEMGAAGLPWRVDVHDAILAELLGEASPVGGPPRRLAELQARIAAAFGVRRLHADSPAELLRAFARAGVELPNTRAWVLRGVEHPAVPLVLEYKELYRIWTAHGWAWRDAWVSGGRFHPEYVPGGVVSGRWATRGGGALQIPKVIRRAVVADPGWTFVVADAGQLEPRVLAAVSGDERLAAAGGAGDLYAALARDAFGGDRPRAKVALLGAMYGQTGGAAVPALAVLRKNYPTAFGYVEAAARTGEAGGLVRSWLGRTCPPGSVGFADGDDAAPDGEVDPHSPSARAARSRGRFTRNFVIQATAAEWASTLLATLRTELAGTGAELVFFQHDEVMVHCPDGQAAAVAEAVTAAGERATRLLFGDTPVRFPLDLSTVDCYADAA
ncbi:bifunctional 3'-5' exonuclease/DNA polymerase [Micromonospora sp. WMMD754]|uniref:bifunctional 3'-5' exonuclease/DNA polymerase n=1 Tax=Micromonospora sp. WMMD754 TaxID=3404114 RepID=UPI003BF48BF0